VSWATATRRGDGALAHADPLLVEYVEQLRRLPRPWGVVGYAVGEVTRSAADQRAELAAGRSDLDEWSGGHRIDPAVAIDVWPIDSAGQVIGDPASYSVLREAALSAGLQTGAPWGDHGHVQLPDWSARVAAVRDAYPPGERDGSAGLALAAGLALGALLLRRSA